MRRTLTIVKREYFSRVKTTAFWVGTLLIPALMVAWIMAPGWVASKAKGTKEVLVLDQTGDPAFFPTLAERLARTARDKRAEAGGRPLAELFELRHVPSPATVDLAAERMAQAGTVARGERAYLLLPAGTLAGAAPEYHGLSVNDPAVTDFGRAVAGAILERRLALSGATPAEAARAIEAAQFKRVRLSAPGGVGGENAETAALVMMVMMYFVTFLYGVGIMKVVTLEKRSRIAEVLLTSARPIELMAGKLLGVGLVGLTQCGLWTLAAAAVSLQGAALTSALGGLELPQISLGMYAWFLLFFLLGYFLYATLYALTGAAAGDTEEAQQLHLPITVLSVLPMAVFYVVLRDPSGPTAVALSLVPFFAPTLMVLRLAVSSPPAWELAASVGLMALAIGVVVWLTAKAYRAGILMSGQRVTFLTLVQALRQA